MAIPLSERAARAKYNRQTNKAKRKAKRDSRKSGPGKRKEGKYVSTQSTTADIGKKYQPAQGDIEHTVFSGGDKQTQTHTKSKYLTDATGKEFHLGDEVTTKVIETPKEVKEGDQHGDTYDDKRNYNMYDNNKKFFGTRINEVYKINDVTPNEKGGKILDKVRKSTIEHDAPTYKANQASDGEVGSITRYKGAKKMHQEKTNRKGTKTKSKDYVSRKYLGEATTFDKEGKSIDGDFYEGEYGRSKKDWRDEGYKVISDKRMERKHRRMGNYKENKTIMSGKRAPGGTDSKRMLETDKKTQDNTFVNIANRLMEGTEKPADIYRETKRQKRNKRKKR